GRRGSHLQVRRLDGRFDRLRSDVRERPFRAPRGPPPLRLPDGRETETASELDDEGAERRSRDLLHSRASHASYGADETAEADLLARPPDVFELVRVFRERPQLDLDDLAPVQDLRLQNVRRADRRSSRLLQRSAGERRSASLLRLG